MSRKYRHRGYQDDSKSGDRTRDGKSPERARRDRFRPERPEGRGLGAPARRVFACSACGTEQAAPTGQAEVCVRCESALWSCTHCTHFDPSAQFQCREPIPAPVRGKAKANDCDRFAPRTTARHAEEVEESPSTARSAFDDLFDGL